MIQRIKEWLWLRRLKKVARIRAMEESQEELTQLMIDQFRKQKITQLSGKKQVDGPAQGEQRNKEEKKDKFGRFLKKMKQFSEAMVPSGKKMDFSEKVARGFSLDTSNKHIIVQKPSTVQKKKKKQVVMEQVSTQPELSFTQKTAQFERKMKELMK